MALNIEKIATPIQLEQDEANQYEMPNMTFERKVCDRPVFSIAQSAEENKQDVFGDVELQDIDPTISNEEYVELSMKQAKKIFWKECGRTDTKRANLGDIKSTRVNIPQVLQTPIFTCSQKDAATTYISGNIKALIPLFREKLRCEDANETNMN